MPFAVERASRIATGEGRSLPAAVGWPAAAALVAGWALLLAISCGGRRDARWSLARAVAGAALVAATVALCEVAARRLLPAAGAFGRVSIGGGAWASIAAGYMTVVASRRETARFGLVARAVQIAAPVAVAAMVATGRLADLGVMREYANWAARYWVEAGNHLTYAGVSVALAIVLGGGVGLAAFRFPVLERVLLGGVSLVQTVPGLAMIGILFGPLSALALRFPALRELGVGGLGWSPVVVALTLYALLVVVHDVVAGLKGVAGEPVEAAAGMGMTPAQVLWRVRLPLAAPVVYAGVRTAALQTIGTATLGAFVAAGTLGLFITQGLAEGSSDLVLLGAVTLVALALTLDALVRAAEPLVVPASRRLVSRKGGSA